MAAPASAQFGPPEPAKVRLVSAETALRPGVTNYLGLLFEIDDGWHIYWNGVNESGFAPTATWTLPRGVEVGPLVWPAPKRYVSPGDVLDHVYEGQTLLIVPIEVPVDARPGEMMTVRAEVDWLVCKEVCLPGYAEVRLSIPVGEVGTEPPPSGWASAFEVAWARVPVEAGLTGHSIEARIARGSVEVLAPGSTRVSYYPQSEAARAEDLLRRGVSVSGRMALRLSPREAGAVRRDPVVRFVIEAVYPGEDAPVFVLFERPLSELGG